MQYNHNSNDNNYAAAFAGHSTKLSSRQRSLTARLACLAYGSLRSNEALVLLLLTYNLRLRSLYFFFFHTVTYIRRRAREHGNNR